jgi:hypothetical protein
MGSMLGPHLTRRPTRPPSTPRHVRARLGGGGGAWRQTRSPGALYGRGRGPCPNRTGGELGLRLAAEQRGGPKMLWSGLVIRRMFQSLALWVRQGRGRRKESVGSRGVTLFSFLKRVGLS